MNFVIWYFNRQNLQPNRAEILAKFVDELTHKKKQVGIFLFCKEKNLQMSPKWSSKVHDYVNFFVAMKFHFSFIFVNLWIVIIACTSLMHRSLFSKLPSSSFKRNFNNHSSFNFQFTFLERHKGSKNHQLFDRKKRFKLIVLFVSQPSSPS